MCRMPDSCRPVVWAPDVIAGAGGAGAGAGQVGAIQIVNQPARLIPMALVAGEDRQVMACPELVRLPVTDARRVVQPWRLCALPAHWFAWAATPMASGSVGGSSHRP